MKNVERSGKIAPTENFTQQIALNKMYFGFKI